MILTYFHRFTIIYPIKSVCFKNFIFQYIKAATRCSVRKGVLRNSAKFTGKYLCQTLYFNKFEDLRPETLFKRRLWHRRFPVNFAKFLRTSFLIEHIWWLLRCQTYLRILDFKLNHDKAFNLRFSEKITNLISYVSNKLFVVFGLL